MLTEIYTGQWHCQGLHKNRATHCAALRHLNSFRSTISLPLLWLIKINFTWILRYIPIPGTILTSINHCHIWLFIKKAHFIWVLKVCVCVCVCVCVYIYIYISLPSEIKGLSHNIKKFKSSLRGFSHQHSFYTLDEYFNYKAAIF